MSTTPKDLLLDHDYDGIKELDNDLPPWWLYLFILSIIFSIIYMLHFHVIGTGDSTLTEYPSSMAEKTILLPSESFTRTPLP